MPCQSAARRHDRVNRHGDVDWERSSDSADSVCDSDPQSDLQNFSDCADSIGTGHGDSDVESDDNDAVADVSARRTSPTTSAAQNFEDFVGDCADTVIDDDSDAADNYQAALELRENEAMAMEDLRARHWIGVYKRAIKSGVRLALKRKRVRDKSLDEQIARRYFITMWMIE